MRDIRTQLTEQFATDCGCTKETAAVCLEKLVALLANGECLLLSPSNANEVFTAIMLMEGFVRECEERAKDFTFGAIHLQLTESGTVLVQNWNDGLYE